MNLIRQKGALISKKKSWASNIFILMRICNYAFTMIKQYKFEIS